MSKVSSSEARRLILAGQAPKSLSVSGSLGLSGCTGLTQLPEGLSVSGSLGLSGCTGLTQLPEGLSVSGDLWLDGCTGLTQLPEGLSVSGDLWLDGCTGLDGGGLSAVRGELRYLYFASPAPWLETAVKDLRCKGLRPIQKDRRYWEKILRISLPGCYDEVYRSICSIKKQLLERPDLEEWQRVVIRMFR